MLGHAKMGEASLLVGKAHMKNALRNMNKSLPNHLLSFQIMKKKNTGVNESNQGHRAKTAGACSAAPLTARRRFLGGAASEIACGGTYQSLHTRGGARGC